MLTESAQVERLVTIIDRLARLFANRDLIEADGTTVTLCQVALLERVGKEPGCSLSELADRLGVTLPTISVAVHRMEETGMLSLQPDPKDGRSTLADLTELGRKMVGEAKSFRLGRLSMLMGGLSQDEREKLLELLERAVSAAEVMQVGEKANPEDVIGE